MCIPSRSHRQRAWSSGTRIACCKCSSSSSIHTWHFPHSRCTFPACGIVDCTCYGTHPNCTQHCRRKQVGSGRPQSRSWSSREWVTMCRAASCCRPQWHSTLLRRQRDRRIPDTGSPADSTCSCCPCCTLACYRTGRRRPSSTSHYH